jgi:enoyl-CoA hydratase/carnithine racemase
MQADIRIAAEGSAFGIPAAKLGIAYGFDMVRRLISLVGHAHARTLLFTGERIDAQEAARIGLVNRVVPEAALEQAVAAMARGIAGNAPLSVAGMKLILGQALRDPADRDMEAVAQAVARCFDSADYTEGRTAFMEKRKPAFRGA